MTVSDMFPQQIQNLALSFDVTFFAAGALSFHLIQWRNAHSLGHLRSKTKGPGQKGLQWAPAKKMLALPIFKLKLWL